MTQPRLPMQQLAMVFEPELPGVAEAPAAELPVRASAVSTTLEALTPQQLSSLTPSEVRTLRYAARGLADKQIAAEIGRSSKTVRFHIRNAMRKVGTRTRLEFGCHIIEAGLTTRQGCSEAPARD